MHTPIKNGSRAGDLNNSRTRSHRKLKLPPESEKIIKEKISLIQPNDGLPSISGKVTSRNG